MKALAVATRPKCEHQSLGYCVPCWRAALARGLNAAEWAFLNMTAAYDAPRRVRPMLPFPKLPPVPKVAGTVDPLSALPAMRKVFTPTEDTKDRSAFMTSQHGITPDGRWMLDTTNGHGAVLVPATEAPTAIRTLPSYMDPAKFTKHSARFTLPADWWLALKRVRLCANERSACVSMTLTNGVVDLTATDLCNTAHERIPQVEGPDCPTISFDARYLATMEHKGPLRMWTGEKNEIACFGPASEDWRLMLMPLKA